GALIPVVLALGLPLSAAPAGLQASGPIAAAEARTGCLPGLPGDTPGETCRVSSFGEAGAVDGHRFHYAVYQYQTDTGARDHMRVVVFEAVPSGMMRAVVATESDPAISYDKPRIVRSGDRVLLHIPGTESGTGNFNRERLYMWRAGQWRDVDTTAWLDELARRLPAG